MNKILKNVIIGFSMLCVVVFIVFLVEMMIINSEGGDVPDPEPSKAGETSSGGITKPTGGQPSGPGAQGGDGTTDSPGEPDNSRPPPTGRRYELEVSEGVMLVLYSDEDLFSYEDLESEEIIGVFTYKGSGAAALEVRLVYMQQGVNTFATNFLSVNYEIVGSSVLGEGQIRNSVLRGVLVTGEKEQVSYEAWIHVFADAEVEGTGFALVIDYENEMQKLNLYEMLDSIDLIES